MVCFLLAGCQSTTSENPEYKYLDPFAQSSTNQILGRIVWVDEKSKQAVVKLASSSIKTHGAELLTRSSDTTTSSLLKPTNIRKNKSLGVEIIYGTPVIGDEVILRNRTRNPSDNKDSSATQKPEVKPNL